VSQLPLLIAEVTVIFAVALLGARLASKARAAVRHLILASAFAVALILPLATLVSPTITVEIAALPERKIEPIATDPVTLPIESGPSGPSTPADAIAVQEMRTPAAPVAPTTWLLFAWALIAAIALVPVGASLWSMRRIRHYGRPWPQGRALLGQFTQASIAQQPLVVLHDGIAAPMTGGLLHPVIALPADAARWSDVHLANALRHELEHVRRHDWVVHLAARSACALYWFHPLAWLAWRALRLEAERACDDAVLAREDAAAYAEQLLDLARRMADKPGLPGLQMATGSNLASRIKALLDNSLPRGRAGKLVLVGIVVAALIAVIALAPLRATGPIRAIAATLVTSAPGISPTLAAEPQPVATPPAPPFPYDSRVGLVALRDDGGCLSIFNSAVAAGTRLTLVRPRSSDPAGVMEATVGERQAGECPASLDRRHDAGIDPTYYRITLSGGSKPPNGEVFAVLDPHGPIALRDGQIEADVDSDGQREFFGTCSSSENVHYVVWTQLPTQRRARWHGNIYYAYDMEVTCVDGELLVVPEQAVETAAATATAHWYVSRPSATASAVSIHYAPPNSTGDAVRHDSLAQALATVDSARATIGIDLGYALNGDLLDLQRDVRATLAATYPREYAALLQSQSQPSRNIPGAWREPALRHRLSDAILRSGMVRDMKPVLAQFCLEVNDVEFEKAHVTLQDGVPKFTAFAFMELTECPEGRAGPNGSPSTAPAAIAARILGEKLPGFRLATSADFVAELADSHLVAAATRSVLRADFDRNGKEDLALLAVNNNRREYRIYYAMATDTGYRLDQLLSREVEESTQGFIRNAMFLKQPREAGVAGRMYSTLPADIPRNEYQAVPAIEVWTGPALIDVKDGRNTPSNGIAYCSKTWYYRPGGKLETFGACD
jgi:beta-lactamase regulating signal transducer with metallopeptidase domain